MPSWTETTGREGVKPSLTDVSYYVSSGAVVAKTIMYPNFALDRDILVRSGVKTPNFRDRMRAGDILVTPYLRSRTTQEGGGGYYYRRDSTYASEVYGQGSVTTWAMSFGGLTYEILSNPVDDLVAEAKLKAFAAVDRSRWGILEDLSESRSALGTLTKPLGTCLRDARRLSNKLREVPFGASRRDAIKLVGDVYLHTKYGLAQLFWTALNVGDELENRMASLKPKRVPISRSRGHARYNGDKVSYTEPGSTNKYFRFSHHHQLRLEVRAGIYYQHRVPERVEDINWRYGLTAKNVVPNAWALMRLSFLIDRFVDVSSAIRSFENLCDPEIRILGGYYNISKEEIWEHQVIDAPIRTYMGEVARTVTGDVCRTTTKSFERVPWTPTIFDTIPRVDLGAIEEVNTLADGFALLASSLRPVKAQLKRLGIQDLGRGR